MASGVLSDSFKDNLLSSLDLSGLSADLASSRSLLDEKVTASISHLGSFSSEAIASLENVASERSVVEARIAASTKMGRVAALKRDEMAQVAASLEREKEELEGQLAHLPTAVETLHMAKQAERAEVEQENANVVDEEHKNERKLNALEQAVACYSARLGLKFEHTDAEELVLVFTLVDETNPKREFRAKVKVHPTTGQYELTGCEPDFDDDAKRRMVNELNTTEDFGAFVRSVRRIFKATV